MTTALDDADIDAIERGTVAAVAPATVCEWNHWLLPFDPGSIGRARAAVPLRHAGVPHADDTLDTLEARYREHHLPCVMRVADVPALVPFTEALQRRGYGAAKPTQVQFAATGRVQQVSGASPAAIDRQPDAAWAALFLGSGADPIDGAHRLRALSRAPHARFASVREGGRTVACGMVALAHGWASVNGMRTDPAQRGRGFAGQVLAGLAGVARLEGFDRVFLQVEEHNAPALALYRRAGFETAWRYRYWQRL